MKEEIRQYYDTAYFVSNLGKVYHERGTEVTQFVLKNTKYLRVSLAFRKKPSEHFKGCKIKQEYVHRMVAETFLEKPEGATEVNHLDKDTSNNRADNLVWMTKQDNMAYKTYEELEIITQRLIDFTNMSYEDLQEMLPRLKFKEHSPRKHISEKGILNIGNDATFDSFKRTIK